MVRRRLRWGNIAGVLLTLPAAVAAQTFEAYNPGGVPTDLQAAIFSIIQTVLVLVGVLALGFLVWGGFNYITARGDEQQIGNAKTMITAAIVGILIIGLAYAIVVFTFQAVGV